MSEPDARTPQPVIYIAEDDDDIRESLSALFARDGFAVRAAPDGARIFDWLFRERGPSSRLPDIIVTDHRMPGYCSLDILDCLEEVQLRIPVIVITGYGPEVTNLALKHGACAVLEKPFDPYFLRDLVRQQISREGEQSRSPSHAHAADYAGTDEAG